MIVSPLYIKGPKAIALRSLRPDQEYRFIRVIQTTAKHITTPPGFIAPKGYGRDANCTSVTHTGDLSVKFLLNFGHVQQYLVVRIVQALFAAMPCVHQEKAHGGITGGINTD